jgi:hypothetical protein
MNPEPSDEPTPKENIVLERPQESWKENKPPAIRGALILVAVLLIFNLVQNLSYFLGSMAPIMRSSRWELFTNPNSPEFHPQWKLALIRMVMIRKLRKLPVCATRADQQFGHRR